MTKPSTTHVIEIETGIGEPAFIPLTVGQELQPISVGKKGMWRIDSDRVLDVHAFVYFDGTSLFLQSADDSAAASVDGYRVGKAWTELHAPCKIEIGAARLRFRSLAADGATEAMLGGPPVKGTAPGGSRSREVPAAAQSRPPTPRPAAGTPPPTPAVKSDPVAFPKPERPFKPGEFSNPVPIEESTRLSPLTATGSRPSLQESTRMEGLGRRELDEHDQQYTMALGTAPVQAIPLALHPPGMAQPPPMMGPPGMMMGHPQGMMMGPGMMTPPPGGFGPQGTGPYGAMGQGSTFGPTTGGYRGEGAAPPPEGSLAFYIAKFKELSTARKITVVLAPFSLIAAAYLLLFDDEPAPRRRPVAAASGGIDAGAAVAAHPPSGVPSGAPPPQPAGACPPGFVPYSVPINGQIPCVPVGTPMPSAASPASSAPTPTPPPEATAATGSAKPPPSASAPSPTTSAKTLERQAVDYIAQGNYNAAAAVYDQLEAQNTNKTNRTYVEAARILRAKADAGVP